MPRVPRLLLLLICLSVKVTAGAVVFKPDSLTAILKLEDQGNRERKLTAYLYMYFVNSPITKLPVAKIEIDNLLIKYDAAHKTEIDYFMESIYETRRNHLNAAENALIKAIELAGKKSDHFLLYTFFSHLAFIQTFDGSTIAAVSNFRTAKNEAIKLADLRLQVVVDINISDIYFRVSFYNQSLFYLSQAINLISSGQQGNDALALRQLKNIIYVNMAENYFRMGKLDSLKKYNTLLQNSKSDTAQLHTFRQRTAYYVDMASGNYKSAISRILALKHDGHGNFDNGDQQNLAGAYFHAGNADSAKLIVKGLLADRSEDNHPEIKFRLYGLLANIAENGNDEKQAYY
jgi:hypothetical protein